MRSALVWTLIPVALIGGAAAGFFAQSSKTKIVTVVQIQTQAPPPPATKRLDAFVQGNGGTCLSASGNYADLPRHTFTLRRPGNGLSEGDVVAVAQAETMDSINCNLDVAFKISPNLGFFVVSDDSGGGSWGPFDSHQLSSRSWHLLLDESS